MSAWFLDSELSTCLSTKFSVFSSKGDMCNSLKYVLTSLLIGLK